MVARRGPPDADKNDAKAMLQGVTALKRGPSMLRPPKPPPAERRAASPKSKHDEAHPVRGGGERKQKWAPRPSRRRGTPEWLVRQTDSYQNRELKIAFYFYHNSAHRLATCQRHRASGQQDKHLPLKCRESTPCTATACNCRPHYRLLAGKSGGIGDGKGKVVRELFGQWAKVERKKARDGTQEEDEEGGDEDEDDEQG